MNYKLNLVIFILFFLSTIVLAFSGGSGTISDPFIITNCIELQDMNTNLDANYALGNDINCYSATREEGVLWNNGLGFQPIGNCISHYYCNFFKGSIDGRNHQIIGLYINRETIVDTNSWSYDSSGLIGESGGVLIKNLGLVDVEIKGGICAGGIVGSIYGFDPNQRESLIINSFVTGKVSSKSKEGKENHSFVGGLVGYTNKVRIINSYFDGNITGKYRVGGLVGVNGDATIIKNSFVSGLITCDNCSYVGGLVGDYYSGTIDNSFNSAEINAVSGYYVGGLAGSITTSTISNSFSAKSASGPEYVGKLIGEVTSNYGISNLNNLFCVSGVGNDLGCNSQVNVIDFYSSELGVYSSWNDGNWVWTGSFFPQLKAFPYCSGPIDGNAVIYQGDWTGLKPTDNLINVLSNSNTSRTCEWKCKEGFEISSNKCVPINYTCTGDIDSNAIVFEGDNEGLVENLDKNLVEADGNTSRKCEYYCKEGYYKSGNSCIAYTCINPIDNASYYEGDNLGLILSGEVNSVLSNSNEDRKCEMFCDTNYHREGVACVRDVEVFSCIGTIPNNAELWDEEEELELVVNVTRTLSAIDTQTKCEYKCSNNFKQFNDTCVPKDYVVASCGSAKRNYYPTDDFPIGSLCSIGNPFPSNPALGENINDSTSWICVGDVNASCSAKRVDYGAPIYDACVLKELNVGRDEE
nr:hypothetical protein [archaeon]